MLPIRYAPLPTRSGPAEGDLPLREAPPRRNETNRQWLRRVGIGEGLLLLGGASLVHFRLRIAQSHARSDLLPSYWSQVGIWQGGDRSFWSVPLDIRDVSAVPSSNGVAQCILADYDDPRLSPNIAVIQFTNSLEPILDRLRKAVARKELRTVVDIPALLIRWLAYVWGVGDSPNPLMAGAGIPSAVLLESLFGLFKIDLTPGLASTSGCPEAIWSAAKHWQQFYQAAQQVGGVASAVVPRGRYALRQPSAAVVE